MTTIAVKDGVMASDSRLTGGYMSDKGTKVVEGRDAIVGFSGDAIPGYAIAEHFSDKSNTPPETSGDDDVHLLILKADGSISLADARLREMPLAKKCHWAIGSGAQAAMVAMNLGCTAAEAVKEAMKVDEYSGGRVREYAF